MCVGGSAQSLEGQERQSLLTAHVLFVQYVKLLPTGQKTSEGMWSLNAALVDFFFQAAPGIGVFFFFFFFSCFLQLQAIKKQLYRISLDSLGFKDGVCLHLDIPKPCLSHRNSPFSPPQILSGLFSFFSFSVYSW